MTELVATSHGGGRQTTAVMVLAARGDIDCRTFLFANVGDKAENPDTLAYHREIAIPFAARHNIELTELRWIDRTGRTRDLYEDLIERDNSLTIPLRDTGGFGNRKCTQRYKIEIVARELRRRGATETSPATLMMGISTDEWQRAREGRDPKFPWLIKSNPLLDLGYSLRDCIRIIGEAGLPTPPKSSCWFCPFQRIEQWRDRKRRQPDLFDKAAELDTIMRARHVRLRGDDAGLASPSLPLALAVDDQLSLFESGECDSGYCMT